MNSDDSSGPVSGPHGKKWNNIFVSNELWTWSGRPVPQFPSIFPPRHRRETAFPDFSRRPSWNPPHIPNRAGRPALIPASDRSLAAAIDRQREVSP